MVGWLFDCFDAWDVGCLGKPYLEEMIHSYIELPFHAWSVHVHGFPPWDPVTPAPSFRCLPRAVCFFRPPDLLSVPPQAVLATGSWPGRRPPQGCGPLSTLATLDGPSPPCLTLSAPLWGPNPSLGKVKYLPTYTYTYNSTFGMSRHGRLASPSLLGPRPHRG